jgi:hypothetical protein
VKLRTIVLSFGLGLCPAIALAQAQSGSPQGMPPMPKPGPEHELLKQDAGTWDAVVETMPAPGAPAMTSKGVETNTLGCGGMCIITEFKGEMMPGMSFDGHGLTTWDPNKKKYVGTWTDSMSQGLMISEATWDAATHTSTGWAEGPDMTGKVTRMKATTEYKDGTRVFTMYGPATGGNEVPTMRITYTRRK